MTIHVVKWQGIAFGSAGIIGFLGVLAMAADEVTTARETFMDTAERFGLFAALTLGLVFCSVGGFVYLLLYVLGTMRECIDDNTVSNMRLRQVLKTRPCLTDSDIDKIAGDESGDDAMVERIAKRRAVRKAS